MALIAYEIETRDLESALKRAELMRQLEPERVGIRQLIGRLGAGRAPGVK